MNSIYLGLIAILLTIFAFIPYVHSILIGETKPHVFSWIIWGLTTSIVFLAQVSDGAGAGAWSIGVSGALTFGVALLAYLKKNEITITRSDWIFFGLAFTAIPCWILTHDPAGSVVLLTTIDVIGFFPTIRKAYINPYEEQILLYGLIALRNILATIALDHFSVTTALFPIATTLISFVLIGVILIRRTR